MASELTDPHEPPYGIVAVACPAMFAAGIAAHLLFPHIIIKLLVMVACGVAIAASAAAVAVYARSARRTAWWPLPAAVGARLEKITGLSDSDQDPPDPPRYSGFTD